MLGGKRVGLLLSAFALGALSVGCGGGDSPAPLTKAQFIKRADAICEAESQRFQKLFEDYVHENDVPLPPERTLAQWTGIVEKALAPTVEGEVERIRELGAPRGDARQVDAMLDAVEDGLGKVREDPSAVANTEEQFARSYRLAVAYGFTACGR